MKIIDAQTITQEVSRLCIEAATYIEDDVLAFLRQASVREQGLAKEIINQIIENDTLAKNENIPILSFIFDLI
mgnify:CR=1 FL=1